VVSESRVTWATSVPILVFLSLSFLDLGLMYVTDRKTSDVRQMRISLNAPTLGGGIIMYGVYLVTRYTRKDSERRNL